MARHCCKVFTLVIPSLVTLVLLIYCLVSDSWITINEAKFENITKLYESDYNSYLAQIKSLNTDTISVGKLINDDKKTTDDILDDDEAYHDYDQTEPDNLFNKALSKPSNSKESPTLTLIKNNPNYVYITKLWPLTKSKSLYSDCLEYKELKLKLSVSYLTSDNKKEPIIGNIHYFENQSSETRCDEKSGMIKCLFTDKCRIGKSCDGVVDCEDQSDEQMCGENRSCQFKNGIAGFKCDNKCWQYWNKCDLIPHCSNLTDEISDDCFKNQNQLQAPISSQSNENDTTSIITSFFSKTSSNLMSLTLGQNRYDQKSNCFRTYFNFKSSKSINKDSLKYLNQQLADDIQEMNNINYHLQLIYTLSFLASLAFTLLALLSLLFIACFKKVCFQCPFWFYGFFQIVSWLTCLFGVMTFLYQFYSNKQKALDPSVQLPIENELLRLNSELLNVEQLGVSFWLAVGATSASFLASFFSCLVCCRLPSSRHEDKEYKIMQIPTYS